MRERQKLSLTYRIMRGIGLNYPEKNTKTILGTGTAYPKLVKLIRNNDFVNLENADNRIDWNAVPQIKL